MIFFLRPAAQARKMTHPPFPTADYDADIRLTVPHYADFHDEALDLVQTVRKAPAAWLDTGCGTGALVRKAAGIFPATRFVLADPSAGMLAVATARCPGGRVEGLCAATQDLTCADGRFDVITAILAHHYLEAGARRQATENCFRMLKPGGVYVTFENIRPTTEAGIRFGLERWKQFQIRNGRPAAEAEAHASRFGRAYFPIPIAAHLDLLAGAGFSAAEVLWASAMQAGFYAVK